MTDFKFTQETPLGTIHWNAPHLSFEEQEYINLCTLHVNVQGERFLSIDTYGKKICLHNVKAPVEIYLEYISSTEVIFSFYDDIEDDESMSAFKVDFSFTQGEINETKI